MNVSDCMSRSRGFVRPSFVDVRTGQRRSFGGRSNTLSYMAAEAMAAAFGGDPSYIPARIGFIYGNEDSPVEGVISRSQSWEGRVEELASATYGELADVQVVGFSFPPTLGVERPSPAPSGSGSESGSESSPSSGSSSESGADSSSEGDYDDIPPGNSNAITFHAVSNSSDSGAALRRAAFVHDMFIYQAVLLGLHEGRHYVLARVSLKGKDGYLRKPAGFEVALDWTVTFL